MLELILSQINSHTSSTRRLTRILVLLHKSQSLHYQMTIFPTQSQILRVTSLRAKFSFLENWAIWACTHASTRSHHYPDLWSPLLVRACRAKTTRMCLISFTIVTLMLKKFKISSKSSVRTLSVLMIKSTLTSLRSLKINSSNRASLRTGPSLSRSTLHGASWRCSQKDSCREWAGRSYRNSTGSERQSHIFYIYSVNIRKRYSSVFGPN